MRGYQTGIPQQAVPADFELQLPASPDLKGIDAFIDFVLGDESSLSGQFADRESKTRSDIVIGYVDRILHLTSALQRLAHVPVFANGRIAELRDDPEREGVYLVKAFLPQVDFFPLQFVKSSLAVAIRLVRWGSEHDAERGIFEPAYALIHEKIIRPIQAFADTGVSTLPILRAAYARDIPFWHLGHGTYLLGTGSRGRLISRSAVDNDSAIGAYTATRKDQTTQLLRLAGLPVPRHFLVSSPQAALQAARELGWPVVVKPVDRERSEGVTTGLKEEAALEAAFRKAQEFSNNILVETHVPGTCFRLMVANKRFLYAVERRPRSVVGNGEDSIQRLIEEEQASNDLLPPWARKKPLIFDEEMTSTIRQQGFDFNSIPGRDVRVSLRAVESTEWGETTFDVTSKVAPENIEIVERAAAVMGLHNAGVDMISTDILRPWYEVGAVINEVNFRPHFGGTSAARERMLFYVEQLVDGTGCVPVEVYVGDDQALEAGRKRLNLLINKGVRAALATHDSVSGEGNGVRQFAGDASLSARCHSLLLDKAVDSIILVVQTDEFLHAGFPVDRISQLQIVNHELVASQLPGQRVAPADIDRLVTSLAALQGRSSDTGRR